MPCKICGLTGHNSRTCLKDEIPDVDKRFFCYILQQKYPLHDKSLTYVGYTVNHERRIRQHNSIITGGALFTKNKGPWEFLSVMSCSTWNNIRAMQVEWLIKHPNRKKKVNKCFKGTKGKIDSLVEIFKRIPSHEQIKIYVHPKFSDYMSTLDIPCNVELRETLSSI